MLVRNPVAMLGAWEAVNDVHQEGPTLESTCLVQMVQLYSQIRAATGRPPVVVDADVLLQDPEAVLRELCARLDMPFLPEMLTWPAGPKKVDGLWAPHWYATLHETTGFHAPSSVKYRQLSPEAIAVIREAMPFYEMLQREAIFVDRLSAGCSSLPPLVRPAAAEASIVDHGMTMQALPDDRNANILVWVADRLVPREMARVHVFDSSVQGGDAVWEGLRIYDGKVFKLEEHLARLRDSAHAMAFEGVPSMDFVKHAIFSTLSANGMTDGTHIRLTLSRGLKITSSMNPMFNRYGCCLIVLAEWKPVEGAATYDNSKGVKLITSTQRRLGPQFLDSKIHHNNLINNILAKIQANYAGAADALMLDMEGFVSETNATNVFAVKRGVVLTPHADYCLPGITRATVMDVVRSLGIELVERRVSLVEFHTADEVFTTGTMGELTPVVSIDGRAIGEAQGMGPVTRTIQQAYRLLTETQGVPLPWLQEP